MDASHNLAKLLQRHDSAQYRNMTSLMSMDSTQTSMDGVAYLLSALREHLNDFASVHRLPPELLSLIFAMVTYIPHRKRAECYPSSGDIRASLPSSGVLTITHVCKRWRTVALQTSALWTYIKALPASDQFRAYVERSRLRPLSVFVDTTDTELDVPHLLDSLSSVGSRLCRLDLALCNPVECDILHIHAPSVRSLTLMCAMSYDGVTVDDSPVQWIEIFGQRESSLEALALELRTNWLPSNTFTHLTHLFLFFQLEPTSTLPTAFFILLAHAPRLEFLHIFNLCHSGTGSTTVALNHLRSLVFDETSWDTLLPFLARLVLPAATSVTVLHVPSISENESLSPPLDPGSPFTNLEICSSQFAGLICVKSASHEYLLHGNNRHWLDAVGRLHDLLSLSAVTTLTVSSAYFGIFALLPLLPHLHQVCHFDLYSGSDYELKDILRSIGANRHLPALSCFTIGLWRSFNDEQPILDAVAKMLRDRACTDPRLPVRRVVVELRDQAHGQDAAARAAWRDYVQANFAPHVEEHEVREVPRSLERPKQCMVEGAEKYWTLYERAKPERIGLYGGDSSGR